MTEYGFINANPETFPSKSQNRVVYLLRFIG